MPLHTRFLIGSLVHTRGDKATLVEKLSEKGFQGFSGSLGGMECSQVRIENTLFEEGFGLNLDSKLCSLRYTSGLANEFHQWASR